jgi:hypothetical protein
MQAFEKLGYVKAEKKGAKYLFSMTEKGKTALTHPHETKDKKTRPGLCSGPHAERSTQGQGGKGGRISPCFHHCTTIKHRYSMPSVQDMESVHG